MPIVVCKLLSSDKDLDLIRHMVVLHPECRCSSSFCKSLEGFFKPLLKHCHFWAVFLVLRALPTGGNRVIFNDWEEVNLCALFCIIYKYSLHSAIPVGVTGNSGSRALITHHAAQNVSLTVRSGWS